MLIKIDDRQLDTILAALRHWQATPSDETAEFNELATRDDTHDALSIEEIGDLCEAINGGAAMVDEKAVDEIQQQWLQRVSTMGMTKKQRLNNQADFFAGAMVARVAAGMDPGNAMRPGWVISIMRGDLIGG